MRHKYKGKPSKSQDDLVWADIMAAVKKTVEDGYKPSTMILHPNTYNHAHFYITNGETYQYVSNK